MLNGNVIASEAVIDSVGLASGNVSRTAGGAAMYEALETMAANTVQPPRFIPARWPRTPPESRGRIGSRMPKAIRNGPDLFQISQPFAGHQPHLQQEDAQPAAEDHALAVEEVVERLKAFRGHDVDVEMEPITSKPAHQHDRLAGDHFVEGFPQIALLGVVSTTVSPVASRDAATLLRKTAPRASAIAMPGTFQNRDQRRQIAVGPDACLLRKRVATANVTAEVEP